jgi:predicted phosphoribosyltransferase
MVWGPVVAKFTDRSDAGRQLARVLRDKVGNRSPLIVALPRGGLPVAYEVSRALKAPLDIMVVRKVGAPFNEEFAIGAMASGGVQIIDTQLVQRLGITEPELAAVMRRESLELARREKLYRAGRPFPSLSNRTVVVVDDGLATGTTMLAAVKALRRLGAARVIVAVPVAAFETVMRMRQVADDCVCVYAPEVLGSVGGWYHDFAQTSDSEVLTLLESARQEAPEDAAMVPEAR